MRAVLVSQLGGPDVLKVEEVPSPRMRPADVMIRVEACGICYHDVVARNGTMRRMVKLPYIPGHEVAGVVAEVGATVTQFKRGDRVATTLRRHICGHCRFCRSGREASCPEREPFGDDGLNGGCAEFVCVEEDNVALIPEGVSFEHASIAACGIGTELNAVRDVAKVQAGERVLITGAGGGLGIHGVQIARLCGATVFAVTTTPDKAAVIREAGAHHVIVTGRGEDFSAAVKEASGGGVDVIIDNVGSPVFNAARKSLDECARWVFVGQLTGEFVKLNPAQLFFRDTTILSAKSGSREQLKDTLEFIRSGAIRPVITESFPLKDIGRAHALVEAGKSVGRVVVRPQA